VTRAVGAPRVVLGQFADPADEMLAFAQQLGVPGVSLNTPVLPGDRQWELGDLRRLRARCEARGLRLEGIENVPNSFYERAMIGAPGRDHDLENMIATVRNLGLAGIPVLGLHFLPTSVWRTTIDGRGRGGAIVSAFDGAALDGAGTAFIARRDYQRADPFVRGATLLRDVALDEDAMWENFAYFIRALAPAAEEAGVRLALHPDDPPVPTLDGVARILRDVGGLERALAVADSPAVGLNLCLGTISAAGGQDAVLDAIHRFGPRGEIVCVHFRDVRGVAPAFEECFLGEGNFDPPTVMRALVGSGFAGFILDDHAPRLIGDSTFAHRGRAYGVGYLQALLHHVTSELSLR
jgi:mannonate dehydratase